jgi:hypothetical protein
MMTIWTPVILSAVLGPGMGQLYNKEYKKAIYLIVLSLIVLVAFMSWMKNILMPSALPLNVEDPVELAKVLQDNANNGMAQNHGTLFVYQLLMFGLWIYGIVDAYQGARRRVREKKK